MIGADAITLEIGVNVAGLVKRHVSLTLSCDFWSENTVDIRERRMSGEYRIRWKWSAAIGWFYQQLLCDFSRRQDSSDCADLWCEHRSPTAFEATGKISMRSPEPKKLSCKFFESFDKERERSLSKTSSKGLSRILAKSGCEACEVLWGNPGINHER